VTSPASPGDATRLGAGRVAGRVAIVTGAARGQGAEHAAVLAGEGAAVVLADVLDDLGEEEAARLRAAGRRATYAHLDVSSADDWTAALDTTIAEYGRIDILVNNAGIFAPEGCEQLADAVWDRVIAVNQTGVFYGMRAALPIMRRQRRGAIVNISSVYGTHAVGDSFAYLASKAAIVLMTKSVAIANAEVGVRANTICPGLIATPMAEQEDIASRDVAIELTPMKRIGQASEVAYAVLFLASDEASYITGTELVVDGGYLAR
jgi:3alpha(or 20beta)-hydroxysteroid dehydrogenase